MSNISVVFYSDKRGQAPALEWIDNQSPKAQDKCVARIEMLASFGHKLRRPLCDYLGDDLYELRFKHNRNQYRLLYFFDDQDAAVLTHGFMKKTGAVRQNEKNITQKRRKEYLRNPAKHTLKV